MSSNNMTGPRKVVKNPYAASRSKSTTASGNAGVSGARKPSPSAHTTTKGNGGGPVAPSAGRQRGLQIAEVGNTASFSQAFASIDDTEHFRNEMNNLNNKSSSAVDDGDGGGVVPQRQFQDQSVLNEQQRQAMRSNNALLQPHVLYVSTKQRGNGVLQYIRNVPYEFSRLLPDFVTHSCRCALFLSLKYHTLYPNYIHKRVHELKDDFSLRVLLVLVDMDDNANPLLFLNTLAVKHNLTLILTWSEEEAARYLETYKAFDGKGAELIQKKEHTSFVDQASDFLCTVTSVNKTDAGHILTQFSTLKGAMSAPMDELSLCPGLGEKKVKRLHEAFHEPFRKKVKRKCLPREHEHKPVTLKD